MEDRRREIETAVEKLNALLVAEPALTTDSYYQGRVHDGALLTAEELEVVSYISNLLEPGSRIVEVGSGLGQIPLILACLGYYSVGVEATPVRRAAAKDLQNRLRAVDTDAGARVLFLQGEYPDHVDPGPHDLLLTTNVANSWWKNWAIPETEKYKRFFRAEHVILDCRVWWIVRETAEQWRELVQEICAAAPYAPVDGVSRSSIHLLRRKSA